MAHAPAPERAELHSFWRQRLDGVDPLELPAGQRTTAAGGTRLLRTLAAERVASLEAALPAPATLSSALLAMFAVLLGRYSGQRRFAVGVLRASAEARGVPCELADRPTTRDVAARMHTALADAAACEGLPLAELAGAGLVQAAIGLHEGLDLPESAAAPSTVLVLHTTRTPTGELLLAWDFDDARFDRASVERMAGHYETLLDRLEDAADVPVAFVQMLTAKEQEELLHTWNDTVRAFREGVTLHQLFEEQVDRTPDSIAVIFEDAVLTYRQLDERANQVAHYLRRRGASVDSLVGICAERGFELIVGLLGILKAGAAYAPMDPEYPRDRLRFMVEDSGVSIVLTQTRLRGLLADVVAPQARLLTLDDAFSPIAREPTSRPGVSPPPSALAYVIYTSGSTGRPKAAMINHGAVCNRLLWQQATFQLTSADRVLHKASIGFDLSVWEVFWPILTGAQLVLARPLAQYDLAYQVELVRARSITILHLMPSVIPVFVELPGFEACASLRQVITGGEAVSFETQERFFARSAAEFANCYGPTECTVDVTGWRCVRGDPRGIVPIGKPLANVQVHVLDENGMLVPVGVPGELHVGGVGVGRGYHRRPDLTVEKFVPDPFSATPGARLYRTGDLVRRLPDGAIEFLGRIDHQVKLRGYRIELGEIEARLGEHPAVRGAVAVVRDDEENGKELVAYVVSDVPEETIESELRRKLGTFLPDYMVPSVIVALPAFPLTPSGKVDRRALPAPRSARPPAAREVS